MKTAKSNPIIVPLEFRVACTINKVNVSDVLQIFIDHVSLYDSLNNVYSEGYTEATKTTSAYLLSKKDGSERSRSFRKCKDTAVNCINRIIKLIDIAPDNVDGNRKKVQRDIIKLYDEMERFYAPTDQLYIDEFSLITLKKDFCIICEMHSCYPNEYLEYFMNNISLAEFHAREDLKIYIQNLALASFLQIVNGYNKDRPNRHQLDRVELDFYQNAHELRISLFNIRDLKERIKIIREYYLSHYYYMNPKNT